LQQCAKQKRNFEKSATKNKKIARKSYLILFVLLVFFINSYVPTASITVNKRQKFEEKTKEQKKTDKRKKKQDMCPLILQNPHSCSLIPRTVPDREYARRLQAI
jgi:hypothetical protein